MLKNVLGVVLFLLGSVVVMKGQSAGAPVEKAPAQFGVRFGYGLEFPSENNYRGLEFNLVEAGHRFNYGAYVNITAEPNVQFSPYIGFEHTFWPKSLSYDRDCELDSFPSFWSIDDSVPGRDIRLWNFSIEPAFKFYVSKLTVWLKLQPHFTLNIRSRIENYTHTCGAPLTQQWLTYEESELRTTSNFNFGLGFGIVKEVRLSSGSGLALEPGFRVMLSPLFGVNAADPDGPNFRLYPWGFYLNLSFFR
ncbi:MAG: hypothetical protein AAF570_18305 [Bacteroidota bacterium]